MSTPDFDVTIPNVARIYDYLIGGKDNYAADRAAANKLISLVPDAARTCHQNRYFLQRVVRYLVGQAGIRQIIDIGTGLPTRGNVHEVAQQIAPETRVIYVDYDPVVAAHARALLADDKAKVAFVREDMRKPQDILDSPEVRDLIDFRSPVAVLLFAVLHFVTEYERPGEIIGQLASAMVPGSYIALSHITDDDIDPERSTAAQEVYQNASAPAVPRSREDILRFFEAFDLVPPGLVDINSWPTEIPAYAPETRSLMYGGVGRKSNRRQA